MAGYVLVDVEWLDEEGRKRYVEMLGPTLERFRGTVVVGTRDVRVEEGDWRHRGILVLIRFPACRMQSSGTSLRSTSRRFRYAGAPPSLAC
jgi:uncharacterized protein (DUF1330 family)